MDKSSLSGAERISLERHRQIAEEKHTIVADALGMPDKATELKWEVSRWEKLALIIAFFIGEASLIHTVLPERSLSAEATLLAALWTALLGAILFRVRVSISYSTEKPIGKVKE